ncbi:hypothetical protein ANCDUO_12447 [Ancylostoma duodenale]|uniref:Uncharacterized protein n=1 Tax=Ancylostoma duodenale TaxID=51022 RepID=A0A0C2D5K4_9BILA|nr:hypothetical protein ANCDUO_12447 [Ancylostoma duodenale]
MVLLSANIDAVAPAPCELKLESGRYIRYVAPKDANPRKEVVFGGKFDEVNIPQRRKSSGNDAIDLTMCWEGVNSLCQLLDAIVETEMETDFFEGKSVLEVRGFPISKKKDLLQIGFATGLPSVYAYENGAAEIALHSPSKSSLQMYCKPTLRRNAIPENKCKFSSGDLSQMRKAIGGKRFDVILAAELLNRSEDEFEMVHQILDEALSHDGICPSHYFTVDSSLASFLDLVKRHRQFDVIERWSSPRTDVVQRKVRNMTFSVGSRWSHPLGVEQQVSG